MISRILGKKPRKQLTLNSIDLDKVDHSFNLLKSTATEVAKEAANAACVLEREQKRTKACFTALNSASDVIFIFDNEENIFFVNDKFVEEFGHQTYDDVIGQNLQKVLPDLENYKAMWERLRRNKSWEDVFRASNRLSIIPMMNGKPEPIYYICTIKPLTRTK